MCFQASFINVIEYDKWLAKHTKYYFLYYNLLTTNLVDTSNTIRVRVGECTGLVHENFWSRSLAFGSLCSLLVIIVLLTQEETFSKAFSTFLETTIDTIDAQKGDYELSVLGAKNDCFIQQTTC